MSNTHLLALSLCLAVGLIGCGADEVGNTNDNGIEETPVVASDSHGVPEESGGGLSGSTVRLLNYDDFPLKDAEMTLLMASDVKGEQQNAFRVYEATNKLIYKREDCNESDREGIFVAHYYPADLALLGETGKDFINRDFVPSAYYMDGATCYVMAQLPDFEVDKLHTGQWDKVNGARWVVAISELALSE